jgi:hypothetical protein
MKIAKLSFKERYQLNYLNLCAPLQMNGYGRPYLDFIIFYFGSEQIYWSITVLLVTLQIVIRLETR